MNTMTANYDHAIESILDFEASIDRDIDLGIDGFTEINYWLKEHLFGFVKVGIAAERIRRFKLWEKPNLYQDWNDYCKTGLGKTSWYINRTIDAAKVILMLVESGCKTLPTCEAQCRPLVKLANGIGAIELVTEAWNKVTSMFAPDKITADRVAAIAEDRDPDAEKITQGISKETLKLAKQLAKSEGKTVDDLMRELLRDRSESNEIDTRPTETTETDVHDEIGLEILNDLDCQFRNQPVKVKPSDRVAQVARRVVKSVSDLRFDWVKTDRGWVRE